MNKIKNGFNIKTLENYKTGKLSSYMKVRVILERTKWEISEDYLDKLFDSGIRFFFGVVLDDEGNLLYDLQEPYKGFFNDINNIII